MANPVNTTFKQAQGYYAESYACAYLQQAGLTLVTRNFRCKFGEIDLIMREQDTLVFVEVRYRKNQQYTSAIESITFAKQQRIRRAAQVYLQHYDPDERFFWRYDWVGIAETANGNFSVEWIPNAWEEDN